MSEAAKPKRSPKRKDRTTSVRLSQREKTALAELATELGSSSNGLLVRLVRELISGGPCLINNDLTEVREASTQLRLVGRNLNQIVTTMHSRPDRGIVVDDSLLEEIRAYTNKVAAAMGLVIERHKNRWAPVKTSLADGQ